MYQFFNDYQANVKSSYIFTDANHIKTCCWPAGQSLSQRTHWEVLIIVDYHHVADDRGCDTSDSVFRIQHFIFAYLANSVPKVNFSGIAELVVSWQSLLTADGGEAMLPSPSFSKSPSHLPCFWTRNTQSDISWANSSHRPKKEKGTFSCCSMCFLPEGKGESDQPATRSRSLDRSGSRIPY